MNVVGDGKNDRSYAISLYPVIGRAGRPFCKETIAIARAKTPVLGSMATRGIGSCWR